MLSTPPAWSVLSLFETVTRSQTQAHSWVSEEMDDALRNANRRHRAG